MIAARSRASSESSGGFAGAALSESALAVAGDGLVDCASGLVWAFATNTEPMADQSPRPMSFRKRRRPCVDWEGLSCMRTSLHRPKGETRRKLLSRRGLHQPGRDARLSIRLVCWLLPPQAKVSREATGVPPSLPA